mgnify:CR=1 FL=1
MPAFRLVPLLTEACPECQTEVVIPFVAGRQVQACGKCGAQLGFELPSKAVGEVLDRVKQVEIVLDDALHRR